MKLKYSERYTLPLARGIQVRRIDSYFSPFSPRQDREEASAQERRRADSEQAKIVLHLAAIIAAPCLLRTFACRMFLNAFFHMKLWLLFPSPNHGFGIRQLRGEAKRRYRRMQALYLDQFQDQVRPRLHAACNLQAMSRLFLSRQVLVHFECIGISCFGRI
jgi:hypothetical protein